MFDSLREFPITGAAVSELLELKFELEQLWIMKDIETLSGEDSLILGDLWKKTRKASILISTAELSGALTFARQIISLEIYLQADLRVSLLIEDGIRVAA